MRLKKKDSILEKNWPRNDVDAKDDPYKTLVFTYNKEMEANIISSEVEEEDCETCPYGGMMESDDEEESIVPKTPCLEDVMTDEEDEGIKKWHQG